MAPLDSTILASESPEAKLKNQWQKPQDILSILLILGGEVIQRALAQASGRWITPVTFSFGWVAYAVTALLSAFGDNKLLPATPDYACSVINGRTGYTRGNRSWVLGRLLRDYDYWKPNGVRQAIEEERRKHVKNELVEKEDDHWLRRPWLLLLSRKKPRPVGLCVSVFEASTEHEAGFPHIDWVWGLGLACTLVQLGIAIIPWVIYGSWTIFLVTAWGTFLAYATGALPQWKAEKWACRKNSNKMQILTRGNGSHHALLILGQGVGLDLEDLAAAEGSAEPMSRAIVSGLALLWMFLLMTVAGLKEHTWFLLGIGGIGMLQNIIVAGAPRDPSTAGIHLVYRKSFVNRKVMKTLMAVEEEYPYVGLSLLETFFPGQLREDEELWWAQRRTLRQP